MVKKQPTKSAPKRSLTPQEAAEIARVRKHFHNLKDDDSRRVRAARRMARAFRQKLHLRLGLKWPRFCKDHYDCTGRTADRYRRFAHLDPSKVRHTQLGPTGLAAVGGAHRPHQALLLKYAKDHSAGDVTRASKKALRYPAAMAEQVIAAMLNGKEKELPPPPGRGPGPGPEATEQTVAQTIRQVTSKAGDIAERLRELREELAAAQDRERARELAQEVVDAVGDDVGAVSAELRLLEALAHGESPQVNDATQHDDDSEGEEGDDDDDHDDEDQDGKDQDDEDRGDGDQDDEDQDDEDRGDEDQDDEDQDDEDRGDGDQDDEDQDDEDRGDEDQDDEDSEQDEEDDDDPDDDDDDPDDDGGGDGGGGAGGGNDDEEEDQVHANADPGQRADSAEDDYASYTLIVEDAAAARCGGGAIGGDPAQPRGLKTGLRTAYALRLPAYLSAPGARPARTPGRRSARAGTGP